MDKYLKRIVKLDTNGRLRSFIYFNCKDCNKKTVQRQDEFKRKGSLCRKCKRKRKSLSELKTKDLELVCAKIILNRLKKRYIHKGLSSNLTVDETYNLVKQNCYYCGEKPSNLFIYKQLYFKHNFKYNGIDRVNSKKGYVKGNVIPSCKVCNNAKSDMSFNKFINKIKKIYANLSL